MIARRRLPTRPPEDRIEVDDEVLAALEKEKQGGESLNDVLRRKLELPAKEKKHAVRSK